MRAVDVPVRRSPGSRHGCARGETAGCCRDSDRRGSGGWPGCLRGAIGRQIAVAAGDDMRPAHHEFAHPVGVADSCHHRRLSALRVADPGCTLDGTVNLSARISQFSWPEMPRGLMLPNAADFCPNVEAMAPGNSELGGSDMIVTEVRQVVVQSKPALGGPEQSWTLRSPQRPQCQRPQLSLQGCRCRPGLHPCAPASIGVVAFAQYSGESCQAGEYRSPYAQFRAPS